MMSNERPAEKHPSPPGMKEVIDLFHHGKPGQIPIGNMSFGFSGRNASYLVRRILDNPEDAFKDLSWAAKMYQWSPIPFTPGHTVFEVLDFGGTARMPSGEYEGTLIMKTHPVETERDVGILSLPADHSRRIEGPRRVHPRPGVRHPGHRSAGQCLCPDPGGSRFWIIC